MEAIHFPLDAVLGLTAPEGPDPVVNTWAARQSGGGPMPTSSALEVAVARPASVVMIGALM
ncbi:MAG TPA: hypothetical protein VLA29_10300 [Acidimicrobiia bacterium]|nr:hypothetical protein [Acidimicrobiia bacterium]